MNQIVGRFEIPLTGRELLTSLRDGKPVQIGRSFLGKAMQLIDQCAEAVVDVRTEGDKAYLTPERFRLNNAGDLVLFTPAEKCALCAGTGMIFKPEWQDYCECPRCTSNPSHQGTTHLVRRTLDGIVGGTNQEEAK